MKEILTKNQIKVLNFIGLNDILSKNYYFTGGTALANFFLRHRLSEDLDFFSNNILSKEELIYEINKLKKFINISKINYQLDKNRQMFILNLAKNNNLKLEFVYFPFGSIKSKKINKNFSIKIDSVKSIGENKILALYESAQPKHAFDLYWITKKYKNLTLKKLHRLSEQKFGVEIDKIILLEKALEAIDNMSKITPLFFRNFKVSKDKLIEYFKGIK